jgi:molybdenum cofactor cytidylyltransferase
VTARQTRLVPAVILAAGQSTRMARPKALLPAGPDGPPFVIAIANALREGGVDDVLVIGRPEDAALRAITEPNGLRFVDNPHAEEGQLSSVVAGVNAVDRPGVAGVLVTPVDVPLITGRAVRSVLDAFERGATIARAVYRSRHGHPVVFARALFDTLRHADPAVGAKAVVRSHAVVDVDVDDAGVVEDVDTPEDYARLFGTD